MSTIRTCIVFALSATVLSLPAFATRTHKTVTSGRARTAHKAIPKSHRLHGQQAIEPSRVTEIQQALVREHYLNAEPNGKWDAATTAAMQKYQSDQGWQTKLTPDSRALKKLGLGPDYSTAINAKDSTFAPPPPTSTIPAEQASGFAQASHANQ